MNRKLSVTYLSLDNFNRPVYQDVETNILFKDVNGGKGTPCLYSCGNEFDGDPGFPIPDDMEVIYETMYTVPVDIFTYQLLSRLQRDCDYFLGFGNRYPGCLWAKDVDGQIEKMKELYNSLPENAKPEWLTMEQIVKYETSMKQPDPLSCTNEANQEEDK